MSLGSRVYWTNWLGAVLAVLAATGLPALVSDAEEQQTERNTWSKVQLQSTPSSRAALEKELLERRPHVRMDQGKEFLRDAHQRWVPLKDYVRIASGSTISDALLLDFANPEHIVSFSRYSQDNPDTKQRYAAKPLLNPMEELEQLLELRPDLVLISTSDAPAKVQRLEERGISVFDLGSARGLVTFLDNARAVATLVGRAPLGEDYARRYLARMRAVAATLPQQDRRTGMYLSMYGKQLYSGGLHTSYDDVLYYGGLRNVVPIEGWPQVNAEQVLAWDPDFIISQVGMRGKICGGAGLELLSACKRGAFVELPKALLSDAGAGMLSTAESIYEQIYSTQKP